MGLWNKLALWKKGAIIGFIIGIIVFPSLMGIYNAARSSYESCYTGLEKECVTQEGVSVNWTEENHPTCTLRPKNEGLYKCDKLDKDIYEILHPFKRTYEGYLMFPYAYFGLAQLIHTFGEESLTSSIILYIYSALPLSILGAIMGKVIQIVRSKRKR